MYVLCAESDVAKLPRPFFKDESQRILCRSLLGHVLSAFSNVQEESAPWFEVISNACKIAVYNIDEDSHVYNNATAAEKELFDMGECIVFF